MNPAVLTWFAGLLLQEATLQDSDANELHKRHGARTTPNAEFHLSTANDLHQRADRLRAAARALRAITE
jgi:hypothetical protein